MIGRAGHWTWTPSTFCLKPKKEMLIFGLRLTSDDQPGWLMNLNPICHPSPTKKMKCSFLDNVQHLMIGRAGQWTRTPSATYLQPKNEMLIFGLHWTSDDWPGWSMDSNPICHPSPTKKMKCLFLYYVQLLMIGGDGQWTQTASTTLLQPENEMLIFVLHSTSDVWPGWLMDLNPIHLLSQAKKNEMLIFGLRLTSDDQPGWLMNLNPICHPSPTKKMKCSFLDYVQLLMIGRAGQWTKTPSATYLQPKNEMLIFGLHWTSDDR